VGGPLDWSEFRPGAFSREETDRVAFRAALLQAIRIAAGLGCPVRLAWTTGPRSRVRLGTRGHRSAVWFRRVLSPAYPPGRWGRAESREGTAGPVGRVRGVVSGLGLPEAASDATAIRWTDEIWPALVQLPVGFSVRWSLTPIERSHGRGNAPRPPPIEERGVPTGFRLAPLTQGERVLRDGLDAHQLRARWRVQGEVCGEGPAAAVSAVARLLRASSAPSRLGRLGVRSPLFASRLSSGLLAGDEEVASLLPPPWAALPWAPTAGPGTTGPPVPLGVQSAGAEVGLPWPTSEGRHLTLLGESGMGKSTLLVRLGLEAARRHVAVVLLDPIGDTAEQFLQRLGSGQLARAAWIAPESMPLAINALAPPTGRSAGPSNIERTLNDVVTALRRVRAQRYPDTPFWGPRIEETVHRALSAAAAWPGGTITVAEALLDVRSGGRSLAPVPARAAVDELRAWVADRPEEVEGSRRLLGEVTRNRWLRKMLCEPAPRWEVSRAVEPGAITVISGEAAKVGESTARYLLAVHLALLWPAILARADPSKIVLVVDEAQMFAHESLAEMLRLGRRYNLHVWAATQSLDALPEPVAEAFRTNAADLVLFRGSPAEAREIGRWNPSVVPGELLRLAPGWSIALIGKGERVETVSTRPLPPARPPGILAEWVRSRRLDLEATGEGHDSIEADRSSDEPTIETVLDLFAIGAESLPAGAELRVPLHRLRAVVPVPDSVVRRAGTELHRLGALRGSGRDGTGAYWRVDRDRFASQHRVPTDPEYVTRLRALWARLRDE
jgi:hypothetical protein